MVEKEMTPGGVEGKGSREGGKCSLRGSNGWVDRLWGFWESGCNALEAPGCLTVGATFDVVDEINLVPTLHSGEAAPPSAAKVYAERGVIIAAVERTGSEKLIASPFEMEIEPVERLRLLFFRV
jgi:hypothetical protein